MLKVNMCTPSEVELNFELKLYQIVPKFAQKIVHINVDFAQTWPALHFIHKVK